MKIDGLSPRQQNDRWGTPLDIILEVGEFDLDPCGMPDHPTADVIYLLENGDDGLRDPWDVRGKRTRVWMNPPYGDANLRVWIDRMLEHVAAGGTGTILIPVATGTKNWMDRVWPNATAIHFWRHRVNFLRRDGGDNTSMVSPTASAIVAFGDYDADMLARAGWSGITIDFRPLWRRVLSRIRTAARHAIGRLRERTVTVTITPDLSGIRG